MADRRPPGTAELRRLRRRIDALDRRSSACSTSAPARAGGGPGEGRERPTGGPDPEREREVLLRVSMANDGPTPRPTCWRSSSGCSWSRDRSSGATACASGGRLGSDWTARAGRCRPVATESRRRRRLTSGDLTASPVVPPAAGRGSHRRRPDSSTRDTSRMRSGCGVRPAMPMPESSSGSRTTTGSGRAWPSTARSSGTWRGWNSSRTRGRFARPIPRRSRPSMARSPD